MSSSKTVDKDKLRTLREKKNWTQEQLCENCRDVSLRTIQRAEEGRSMSLSSIKSICEALGVHPDTITSPAKLDYERRILPRIILGKDIGVFAGCDGYLFDTPEPESEYERELIGAFLQNLEDYGNIWDDLGAKQRMEAEQELKALVEELADSGFWVFGEVRFYTAPLPNGKPPIYPRVARVIVRRQNEPWIRHKHGNPQSTVLIAHFPTQL